MVDIYSSLGIKKSSLQKHCNEARRSLPSVDRACRHGQCPKGSNFIYAAVSVDLNVWAMSSIAPDGLVEPNSLEHYIFKIGTTGRCFERKIGLNTERIFSMHSGYSPRKSIYAGVSDWIITKCWAIPDSFRKPRGFYEEGEFFIWMRNVVGVKRIFFSFETPALYAGKSSPTELISMDQNFISFSSDSDLDKVPHKYEYRKNSLHEEILVTARDAMKNSIVPLLKWISSVRTT